MDKMKEEYNLTQTDVLFIEELIVADKSLDGVSHWSLNTHTCFMAHFPYGTCS